MKGSGTCEGRNTTLLEVSADKEVIVTVNEHDKDKTSIYKGIDLNKAETGKLYLTCKSSEEDIVWETKDGKITFFKEEGGWNPYSFIEKIQETLIKYHVGDSLTISDDDLKLYPTIKIAHDLCLGACKEEGIELSDKVQHGEREWNVLELPFKVVKNSVETTQPDEFLTAWQIKKLNLYDIYTTVIKNISDSTQLNTDYIIQNKEKVALLPQSLENWVKKTIVDHLGGDSTEDTNLNIMFQNEYQDVSNAWEEQHFSTRKEALNFLQDNYLKLANQIKAKIIKDLN